MRMRRFTFLVDEEVFADLEALATYCDGNVSGLLRDMIHRTLRQYYACGGQVSAENPRGMVEAAHVEIPVR